MKVGQFPIAAPDIGALFQAGEFAQDACLNGDIEFLGILHEFYAELEGQEVGMYGTAPTLLAEHCLIPDIKEGDTLSMGGEVWFIREVRPDNTGVVRCRLEEMLPAGFSNGFSAGYEQL